MNEERMYNVIVAPMISEKSSLQAELNGQHTFHVAPTATKLEVRSAIEKLFKVNVISVRIANVKGKVKARGQSVGRRATKRKAIVRLAEGQDIDYMAIES